MMFAHIHSTKEKLYGLFNLHVQLDFTIGEEEIYINFKELLENQEAYDEMAKACNPYGDGHACKRIADILEDKEYHPWIAE